MADSKLIVLTNDDGIFSPGLWAAAAALESLGELIVAAPRHQNTAAGRSMPAQSSGRIHLEQCQVSGRVWPGYAVEGTPAQAVQHAVLELCPRPPDLIVAGINYGENVGTSVTISGTVGAALEAASLGIPSLAVSLQVAPHYHHSHSADMDFSAAAHFTRYFAERWLSAARPADVDVLKIEVPETATPQTPWRVTRLARHRYYTLVKPERAHLHEPAKVGYRRTAEAKALEVGSDVEALLAQVVSVTPLSLDLTSRVALPALENLLR